MRGLFKKNERIIAKAKRPMNMVHRPEISGSPTWTRTRDLRINSPSLYRLSYQGTGLKLCYTFFVMSIAFVPKVDGVRFIVHSAAGAGAR